MCIHTAKTLVNLKHRDTLARDQFAHVHSIAVA